MIAVRCFGFFLVQEVFPIMIYVIVLCAVNVRCCCDFVLLFVCKLTVHEKRKESLSSSNALVVGGERERFWSSVLLQSRFRIRFITKSFWCCFQSVGVG